MTIVDHLFVLALATFVPWYVWRSQKQQTAASKQGDRPNRRRLYWQTSFGQWCVLAAFAVLWFWQERSLSLLGFVAPGGQRFWIGAALCVAVLAFMAWSFFRVRQMSAEEKQEQLEPLGDLGEMLPQNRGDLFAFSGLSFTAGVVEEIIFRGFLFWYFLMFLPAWAVVLVTGALFGLGHSYQGASNVLRITGIGIAMGSLYLLTGSLWLPIAMHFLGDVVQGMMLVEMHRDNSPPNRDFASAS